ncbi:hypothetical protein amrb99_95450 [Actinomadura sp. RB99]|uniref:NucA/NucB deoxyribonuclease domain-containing protein n=1 Tax=Actinomadura sp. RB99 TaxID=2691577 RepID=UPI0016868168|nr:NucA/NucB deoxyribonuclease domain-containing protein [Actinomadura sp. RB99]MBD2900540.1 hypothetical protein [Actinomadura sp. RB99]
MDRAQQVRNRRAVCGRPVVGPPPHRGVNCDEYPFASSRESGTVVSHSSRSTEWVPTSEQNRQGGLIATSLAAQRVLYGEAFYVAVWPHPPPRQTAHEPRHTTRQDRTRTVHIGVIGTANQRF